MPASPPPPSARRWPIGSRSRRPTRRCWPRSIRSPGRSTCAGKDVEHTPVALSFALVNADGTADLFVASEKIGDEVRQHLGNGVRVHERRDFEPMLASLAGKTVAVDPERSVAAIFEALEKAGAHIISKRDPSILPKAIKNQVEIAGHQAAQARDGAALSRFLHWLSIEAPKGGVDELKAAAKLQAFRQAGGDLRDLSFDTISGAGPNGAIVHYQVNEETNRPLEMDSIYLVDSGGQYPDGTTDVTRTVVIGTPTAEMKDRFTRVLQGHIAIARALFPEGTRGSQLDSFARQYPVARRASITPTAPATASAASSPSTKGRSASRRSAAPSPAATSRLRPA